MKVFGLIGYPLTHSFSKAYFRKKFKNEKINNVEYLNIPISKIELFPNILKTIKGISGINVTAPYKEQIIPFLDELDKAAEEIKAVNVIKIVKSENKQKLIGYNTDVYGFVTSLQKHLNPKVKNALILGTGGAAKAVAYALKSININYTFVSSKAQKIKKGTILYSDLDSGRLADIQLIINATPLGMFPDVNRKPDIPYQLLTNRHILFDLIYNPAESMFLKEGIKRRAKVLNGLEMLELQAEKAWEIFNS